MAAAALRRALGPGVTVESAGVTAGDDPAAAHAIALLQTRGIDLSDHRSRHIDAIDLHGFDVVIALSERIANQLSERGVAADRLLVWPVKDPIGGTLDDYRAVLAAIDQQVAEFLPALRG
jgi:protein-tyrosine-phosphatase